MHWPHDPLQDLLTHETLCIERQRAHERIFSYVITLHWAPSFEKAGYQRRAVGVNASVNLSVV
jgi:hypothetical protein